MRRKTSKTAAGPLVNRTDIRLAMLGMVEGNGHPYSWSAIFNGYDPKGMAKCPYAGIRDYLGKQPKNTFGIDRAHVTHIWTDDPADAKRVARASRIPHVVKKATDVIGHVDAVIVATDKGNEHVERCRPFVEAGLPVFVDKPLADNEKDLRTFIRWVKDGKPILSSSCMRYSKEFAPYRTSTFDLGELRFVSITMAKKWETYGIHALESMYPILGPGFVSVQNTGSYDRNIVHMKHERGVDIVAACTQDLFGAFGVLGLYGTAGHMEVSFRDTYYAFKAQLAAFVEYLRTGVRPFPFEDTIELMQLVIAGIKSRKKGGVEMKLADIKV